MSSFNAHTILDSYAEEMAKLRLRAPDTSNPADLRYRRWCLEVSALLARQREEMAELARREKTDSPLKPFLRREY